MTKELELKLKELEGRLADIDSRMHLLYAQARQQAKNGKKMTDREELDWYNNYVKPLSEEKKQVESQIRSEKLLNVEVGDGVSICCWTDVYPYTVIRRTAKTITIQADDYRRIDNNGAYSESQKYEFSRNENGDIETFRWNGKRWVNRGYRLSLGRNAYYDYTF